MKQTLVIASTVFAGLLAPALGSSVLTDTSFENSDPLVDDGNGVGKWNPFSNGSASFSISSSPRTGSSNLLLDVGGAAGQFAGVFQDLPVNPGDDITIDLWHFANNNDPGSASEIRIEWFGGGAEISRTGNSTPSPGTTYENFSIIHTAPAGADTARVVYAIQSFGGNTDAILNIDDFTATGSTVPIPEPSGSVLLSLGMLGLLARRKRS